HTPRSLPGRGVGPPARSRSRGKDWPRPGVSSRTGPPGPMEGAGLAFGRRPTAARGGCGVGGVLSGPVRCVRSAAGSAFAVLSEFLLDGVDRAGVRRGGGLSATDVFPALLGAFGFGA